MTQERTLDELTQAAADGDRDAMNELVTRSLPELRAFVRARAGRIVEARDRHSDIVQSVCREILTRADRFEHPNENAFRRWLFATALRKLQHRREYNLAARRDLQKEGDADPELHSGGAPTPSHHAEVREDLVRVERAMSTLDDEDREIIVLARILGLSSVEIADELCVKPGAVRMRLHRALGRLALALGETPEQ